MNIRIKRLHDAAVIPTYAHVGDSGFDLVAVEDVIVEPGQTVKVPTGLAFEIPSGYELQVRPRSGVTSKTKLRVQFGTVDSGFRGEVAVMVDNIFRRPDGHGVKYVYDYDNVCRIRKGTRIAQGVIAPVITASFTEADELTDTERNDGGFGSTGT